jgi:hypothetical protein
MAMAGGAVLNGAERAGVDGVRGAGGGSPSWARQVCEWSDQLPPDVRDDADPILLESLVRKQRLTGFPQFTRV